jgi:hypothetical protein
MLCLGRFLVEAAASIAIRHLALAALDVELSPAIAARVLFHDAANLFPNLCPDEIKSIS